MMQEQNAGSYRGLQIYQLSHSWAVEVHHFTLCLPRFEQYETASQLRRASKSVSANTVEGYGRRAYKADFVKFLVYAHSSCDESVEWLQYICNCHETKTDEAEQLKQQAHEISRKLNRFIQTVSASHRSTK